MVPPASHRVSRAPRYSGSRCLTRDFAYGIFTLCDWLSQNHSAIFWQWRMRPATPKAFPLSVWPLPGSLATTSGITLIFFSCRYLDVSVHGVSPPYTMDSYMDGCGPHSRVSPFGHPRFLRLFAPTRGFSQLSASFFGSWRQGILPLLFFA